MSRREVPSFHHKNDNNDDENGQEKRQDDDHPRQGPRNDDDDDDDDFDDLESNDDDGDDDDDCYADMGFLFEGSQRTERQTVVLFPSSQDPSLRHSLQVTVKSVPDDPGALQSGHYLWPAARLLLQYLLDATQDAAVQEEEEEEETTAVRRWLAGLLVSSPEQEMGMIELGAGCGLVGLGMMQLLHQMRQLHQQGQGPLPPPSCCMVFTDHDPGTLSLCQENWNLMREGDDRSVDEDDNHAMDSTMDSAMFVQLRWGDAADVQDLFRHVSWNRLALVLGSDLIYCPPVVRPLLQSATWLLSHHHNTSKQAAAFVLAQSFAYDETTETEIHQTCQELQLNRVVLVDRLPQDDKKKKKCQEAGTDNDDDGGPLRIQAFYLCQGSLETTKGKK